jgi:hypothetical protein
MRGRKLEGLQQLLRILPYLSCMRTEGKPQAYQVRLKRPRVLEMFDAHLNGYGAHKQQNSSTEVHEALHSRLIERVLNRVGVLVVTLVAPPLGRATSGVVRTTAAD